MSLEGLKLAALYSYGCQKAERLKINDLLSDFIIAGTNRDVVEENLKKLLSYAWYQIIARSNKIKDPFDERVVRTYWTGSRLLRKIRGKDGRVLLPFHNFTVLGAHNQEQSLRDLDNCKVSIGRIEKMEGDNFSLSYYPLIERNGNILLADFYQPLLISNRGFVHDAKIGEWVTSHYRVARQILSYKKAKQFYFRSLEAVELFNKSAKKAPHL